MPSETELWLWAYARERNDLILRLWAELDTLRREESALHAIVVEHDTNEGEKVRKLMAELRLFNHFDAARVMAKDQTLHGLQQSIWAEEESLRNKYG
jgi:hypothetical protein